MGRGDWQMHKVETGYTGIVFTERPDIYLFVSLSLCIMSFKVHLEPLWERYCLISQAAVLFIGTQKEPHSIDPHVLWASLLPGHLGN